MLSETTSSPAFRRNRLYRLCFIKPPLPSAFPYNDITARVICNDSIARNIRNAFFACIIRNTLSPVFRKTSFRPYYMKRFYCPFSIKPLYDFRYLKRFHRPRFVKPRLPTAFSGNSIYFQYFNARFQAAEILPRGGFVWIPASAVSRWGFMKAVSLYCPLNRDGVGFYLRLSCSYFVS